MVVLDYIYWHYGIAPAKIFGLLHNYLIATWHRFLIGTHAKTMLSPWHRTRPSDVGTTQTFEDKIANAIVDFYIRIVAAFIRLIIIVIGLMAEFILIIVFLTLLIVWFLWPVVLFLFLINGIHAI